MRFIIFPLLILLSLSIDVFGQQDLGVKANIGLSRIVTNFDFPDPARKKLQFAPSGQAGLYYSKKIKEKTSFGAELLFVQIEDKMHVETPMPDNQGNYTGEFITNKYYKHLSYMALPVYYGININKISVNAGLQFLLLITSNGRQKGEMNYNGEVISWDNNHGKLNIDRYDFGPRAGIIYKITEKFDIEANYYQGINNIINNSLQSYFRWRNQQLTIGMRYKFLNPIK
ncbi:MAG: PorT family protein [Bacteroidetes bacterium]|nr:PorT family protein [Bacteroidota bacterium]HET6245075.1 outer membrane beta-barrel protein [Bacteroidia bacterium]